MRHIVRGLALQQTYIHVDAALAGIPAALLSPHAPFDFADGADSISVSGHKFIGSPFPSGIVLVRKSYHQRIGRMVSYINSRDTTISGSRNGHAALLLWYAVQRWGVTGFRKRAQDSADLAAYVLEQLRVRGWAAWRNPNALTVLLPEPPAAVRQKWQLATHEGWSHIICMPGVTKERINAFLEDLGPA
jgi:histidine decarboxylase